LILGIGQIPLEKLTVYDALNSSFRTLMLRRDPSCRLCGERPEIFSVSNSETSSVTTCASNPIPMESITTAELRQILNNNFKGLLIDVREPAEYHIAHIQGSKLIPLGQLPDEIADLPKDQQILVHCKAGGRSTKAVKLLLENGFTHVKNVTGGMDAWLTEN
jgi:rhodanese-related sulfurtransferase